MGFDKVKKYATTATPSQRVYLTDAMNVASPSLVKKGMATVSLFQKYPKLDPTLRVGTTANLVLMKVDLSPFSAFVKDATAVQIKGLLDRYYGDVIAPVDAANGVVEKFIGDAVIAVFGSPFNGSDKTSWTDVTKVVRLSQKLIKDFKSQFGEELSAKCAVSFGEVFLGYVGQDPHEELTVVGTPLTTLFRLEEEALPRAITLTRTLFDGVKGALSLPEPGKPTAGEWTTEARTLNPKGVGTLNVVDIKLK